MKQPKWVLIVRTISNEYIKTETYLTKKDALTAWRAKHETHSKNKQRCELSGKNIPHHGSAIWIDSNENGLPKEGSPF